MEIQLSQDWEKNYKVRTITSKEWDTQRDTFTRLYITEGRNLTDVRRIMADRYKFFANPKQCKTAIRRWGLGKNFTKTKTIAMLKIQRKRALQGKDTDFTLNGQLVDRKNLDRAQKKYCGVEGMGGRDNPCLSLDITTPLGIGYSTPKEPSSSIHDSFRVEGGYTPHIKPFETDIPLGLNLPEGKEFQDIIPFTPAEPKKDLSKFMSPSGLYDLNTEDINTLPFSLQASEPFFINLKNTIDLPGTYSTGVIPPGPHQAPMHQGLMEWDPISWDNGFIETGFIGEKESYLAPGTNAIDYTTSLQLLWRNSSGRLVRDAESLGDEIERVKEGLAKLSRNLARLMEERWLLGGVNRYDEVTLTIYLVKVEGMLHSPEHSYTAQRLVVLGCERTQFGVYNSM